MNLLPTKDMAAILAHDHAEHVSKRLHNKTRFYLYLFDAWGDIEVHTVAVKGGKYGPVAKEVVRASAADPYVYVKDLVFVNMAGYLVDWSRERMGPERQWGYTGKWGTDPYSRKSGLWKLQRPVINPEVLKQSERFKYCAWNPSCGHILDYLKAYSKHPRIEILSKSGAGRFACKTGFVRQLEKDKRLARFFMDNLPEINAQDYNVDVIRIAYRHGVALAAAKEAVDNRRLFHGYGLPATIDACRAARYVKGGISHYSYCHYLHKCQKLGLDLHDTKVSFPRNFQSRYDHVKSQVYAIEQMAKKEEAAKVDSQIAAVASAFSKLERKKGALMLTLPRSHKDLIKEGESLHNCLGLPNYAMKIAGGESLLAFVRKSSRPYAAFVAVEYSLVQSKVVQCYAAKNQKPPAEVLDYVGKCFGRKLVAA